MSDKCPKCGWLVERFGVVANCTRPDCTYSEDADDLRAENARLQADNARLQAIVDRLDKTKDGVRVSRGDTVFSPEGKELYVNVSAFEEVCIEQETDAWELGDAWGIGICYSTRELAYEAAEAARETP